MNKPRTQKIRARARMAKGAADIEIGGWLNGRGTYIWFGDKDGKCLGWLDGGKLYRLAKAITRHYEAGR